MTPARRDLVRARIATSGAFLKESCSSVIVGHALSYKPTKQCEDNPGSKDAVSLKKKILLSCFAEAITIVSPAALCETHAEYLVSSFVWLNVLMVTTAVVMSEWIHYSDDPP